MINVLHMGLSYACNMRCKHCFVDKLNDRISTNTIKKTIETLINKYCLFIVYYTYGEPLLANNFDEVSSFCEKNNLVQILMTNGSIIDEEKCKMLKKNKISKVFVSLDSYIEDNHDNNRGYKGAYEKAILAIKMLKSYGIPVGIATAVTEFNCNEIFKIGEIVKELKIDTFSLLRGRTSKGLSVLDDGNDYYNFVKWYLTNIQDMKYNLQLHDPSLLKMIQELYNKNKISRLTYEKYTVMNSCNRDITLAISPNGDVSHCNLIYKKLGNVEENNIEEILNNEVKSDESIACYSELSRKSK